MAHKTLAAAFVAAQANMKHPRLTGDNPHFGSKFVPRDEALDAVLPALHAEGLALIQAPCSDENGYGCRTILLHADSGETLDLGAFTVKPQKSDPQGAVAATTYASRTGLMLVCARAGDPDDDGNKASEEPDYAGMLASIREVAEDRGTKQAVADALGNPRTKTAALEAFRAMSDTERTKLAAIAAGTVER